VRLRANRPSLPVLICGLAVALIVVVAVIDLQRTRDELPDTPEVCGTPLPPGCEEQRADAFTERLRESGRLSDDYEERLGLYRWAVMLLVGIATSVSLARRPQNAARVFANLGIAAVWGLIALVVLALVVETGGLSIEGGPVFVPIWIMLAVAALGWLIAKGLGRDEEPEEERAGAEAGTPAGRRALADPTARRALVISTVALTALALVFALIWGDGQGGCDGSGDTSGFTDFAGGVATVCALMATVAGIATLVARNWLVALIGIGAIPGGFIAALMTNGICFS
jgi:hypothetical protein